MLGFLHKATMKLKGRVAEKEVVVLIDCGATHNFIHQKLVDKVNLPLSETTNYGMVVGSGVAIQGKRGLQVSHNYSSKADDLG